MHNTTKGTRTVGGRRLGHEVPESRGSGSATNPGDQPMWSCALSDYSFNSTVFFGRRGSSDRPTLFEEMKKELKRKGVSPALRRYNGPPSFGVGRSAPVLYEACPPVSIGKQAGLVRLTVVWTRRYHPCYRSDF